MGDVIDKRFVRMRCKNRHCLERREGFRHYHLFDIYTGAFRTVYQDQETRFVATDMPDELDGPKE